MSHESNFAPFSQTLIKLGHNKSLLNSGHKTNVDSNEKKSQALLYDVAIENYHEYLSTMELSLDIL